MIRRYPFRPTARLAPLVVVAVLFAGCGGSSETSTTEPVDTEPASTTTSPLFVRNESSSEGSGSTTETTLAGTPGDTTIAVDTATTIPGGAATVASTIVGDGTTGGAVATTAVPGQPSNSTAVVITVAELEAAGLGTGWTQDVEVLTAESDRVQDENICRIAEINVPGAVYADSTSAEGAEFQQTIGVGNGVTGVEVYAAMATCPDFLADFGSEVKTVPISVVGATSATAFEVQDGADVFHWYAANFSGDLVTIFYLGNAGSAGQKIVPLLALAASRL